MRRSALWIVVGCVVGIFGCSSAKTAKLQPLGDTTPSGVAVIIPDKPASRGGAASGSAADQSASARRDSERSRFEAQDAASSWNKPSRRAMPSVRVEPPIGVTVMRLLPKDNPGSKVSASANVISASGAAASTAHAIPVSSNAKSSTGASGNQTVSANQMVAATTTNGTRISFSVGDAPSTDNSKAAGASASSTSTSGATASSASVPSAPGAKKTGAPSAKCSVRILKKKPKAAGRKVATFKFDAVPRDRKTVMALLKQRACEAGANALLITKSKENADDSTYHIEAAAFVLKSAESAHAKPVPKTIEVPLPSKPVPKTITVDPDMPG